MTTGRTPRQAKVTVDEYLRRERAAEERSYYLDGTVVAMAGESQAHGRITFNLTGLLYPQLVDGPCEGFVKDSKVRSGPARPRLACDVAGLFSYPDVVIVCGEPEYYDEYCDIILNPKVVIEVLSPSTEAFDRGEKFGRYRNWNTTLSDYVLVSQHRPLVEVYTRKPDGGWDYRIIERLDGVVELPAIRCTLKMAALYGRVEFPPTDDTPEPAATAAPLSDAGG